MTHNRHLRAPARSPAGRETGFTLVELMVALFVVALLAGIAVLSLPDSGAALRRDAEKFAARVNAARDEAIVRAVPVALVVGPAGYYFEERSDGAWIAAAAGAPEGGSWDNGTTMPGGVAGRTDGNRRIVFDPLGLASEETRIDLVRGDHRATVTIRRDGAVRVVGAPP